MTEVERFWRYVNKDGTIPPHIPQLGKCWIWTRCRNKKGYGRMGMLGKSFLAHRIAWFFTFGEWSSSNILHACDNSSCVNPSHLFEGTIAENNADMLRKGRYAKTDQRGQNHKQPNSKLNYEKADEIRMLLKMKIPQRKIANMFGVSQPIVGRIAKGIGWQR